MIENMIDFVHQILIQEVWNMEPAPEQSLLDAFQHDIDNNGLVLVSWHSMNGHTQELWLGPDCQWIRLEYPDGHVSLKRPDPNAFPED